MKTYNYTVLLELADKTFAEWKGKAKNGQHAEELAIAAQNQQILETLRVKRDEVQS